MTVADWVYVVGHSSQRRAWCTIVQHTCTHRVNLQERLTEPSPYGAVVSLITINECTCWSNGRFAFGYVCHSVWGVVCTVHTVPYKPIQKHIHFVYVFVMVMLLIYR
jgi:hypothetical protein